MNPDELKQELLPMCRAYIEDGIRIGIGMSIRVINEVLNKTPEMSTGQRDALMGVRDGIQQMSAEFTMDGPS